ncbi:NAD-binding protein [Schizopora paradoxa]|uniref:NAD-binding protein n=1 Tax=Schizopora paradoxa TaxID=27342 RepID=A0A0H2SDU1_9AGAM|nr:NAD-binding protein [Schizopora paradoxa]
MSSNVNSLDFSAVTDLTGRVALVTGGGTGIGLMIAKGLASNGATVYVGGRRVDVLEEATHLRFGKENEKRIIALQLDVTDKSSILSAVDTMSKAHAKLDILINNAGHLGPRTAFTTTPDAPERASCATYGRAQFDSQSFEDWGSHFALNIGSTFFVTNAFLGLLEASTKSTRSGEDKQWASVINITSAVSSFTLSHGYFAYVSSKAALGHLTKVMANDLAMKGMPIRINAISPGVFPSELTASKEFLDKNASDPGTALRPSPMLRPGREHEIAALAVYMASPASNFMMGHEVLLDGGLSLVNP